MISPTLLRLGHCIKRRGGKGNRLRHFSCSSLSPSVTAFTPSSTVSTETTLSTFRNTFSRTCGILLSPVVGPWNLRQTNSMSKACVGNMSNKLERLSLNDPNSFANSENVRVEHMDIVWDLNFTEKVVSGTVKYTAAVESKEAVKIILDTNSLNIKSVTGIDGAPINFKLGSSVSTFGQPLIVDISSLTISSDNKIQFQVKYETASQCNALQWLDKEQTAGKQFPYVFSQCQAIYARSLLPCQDTPSVKATYNAAVSVPKELQALMSAVISDDSVETGNSKTYNFAQKIPVQSYLIAIAAGSIKGKRVGPRCTVWTEPEVLEAAAYEFEKTEEHLVAAEKVLGEYVWGIYDLLVLPPSFPFGGMENPCLTFVTPTLLAGDRSLNTVVYHEIAHSWTGNLVTNKNFEHFWLNEGFTMFAERKIQTALIGESYRQLSSITGLKDLMETIETMKPDNQLTCLVPDLTGVDPDDAFSTVPYEKGYTFLYYLEEKVGGKSLFEPFFRDYIRINRFKSIDTEKFKSDFTTYFTNLNLAETIKDIDWNGWLYTPGMPLVIPKYDTTLADACVNLKNKCLQWDISDSSYLRANDFKDLIPLQMEEFLNLLLLENLSVEKLKALQEIHDFNGVKNSEIRFRWIRLGLRARWICQVPRALQFVSEQGRMKFVRPIYRDLYGWEEVRSQAIEHFRKNRASMMHVSATMVGKDLGLRE